MKKYLVVTMMLWACQGYSQTTQYLQLRIQGAFDFVQKQDFFWIVPEPGCPAAGELYTLRPYDGRKNAANGIGRFYHLNRYGTDSLFNYFVSPTAILNYLAYNGWQLVNVYPETASGVTYEPDAAGRRVPLTTVNSRLVYLWKK